MRAHAPTLTMPTTVIHGRGDRMISPRAGARTALAIPGAVHMRSTAATWSLDARRRDCGVADALRAARQESGLPTAAIRDRLVSNALR